MTYLQAMGEALSTLLINMAVARSSPDSTAKGVLVTLYNENCDIIGQADYELAKHLPIKEI